ncbi:MAG: ethanolamine ammonia-lyase light chain EutC, partial [Rhodospirillaceae bacterium]|nr:ethanolamine ammonia-lyase light chain EutC [Rhodospirillaceae bacterium]
FVIADGLSATAVTANAKATLLACIDRLPQSWTIGPVVLAEQARVALGDDIAHALGAKMVAILIGERPGLSVADSLGIYLTLDPHPGRLESERNCISNIHDNGLSHAQAGAKLAWLASEARKRGLTGIGLKDEAPPLLVVNEKIRLK